MKVLFQNREMQYLIGLITLTFVILASIYSLTIPIFEAPDEVGHFYFIVHILKTKSLPDQLYSNSGEAHQPPLYYLLAALPASFADLADDTGSFLKNQNTLQGHGNLALDVSKSRHGTAETFPYHGETLALRLARLASILMGGITVILTAKLGWEIFPNRPIIGLLAASLVAFNPQFIFISSVLNNDNLLILASTGALLQIVRLIKQPERFSGWWCLGVWLAISVLAKINSVTIVAVAGVFCLAYTLRQRSFKFFIKSSVALATPIILLSGWWFVRNQVLYGDPLGWRVFNQIYSVNSRQQPLMLKDINLFFRTQFQSFFGVFGWMNIGAPSWFFNSVKIIILLGIIGLVYFFSSGRFYNLGMAQKATMFLFIIAILSQEALMLYRIIQCNDSCYQGRYMFPVIGGIAILLSIGLIYLAPRRFSSMFASGLVASLIIAATYMPFKVIRPAYAIPVLPKWRLHSIANPMNVNFDETLSLIGYRLDETNNSSKVDLTLYWQAQHKPQVDYTMLIKVFDQSNQLVLKREQIPGNKQNYPPTFWLPGDVVEYQLAIQFPQAFSPGVYRVQLRIYDPISNEYLCIMSEQKTDRCITSFEFQLE